MDRLMEKLADGVARRRAVRGLNLGGGSYFAWLRNAGERVRDYVSWRNAALLQPRFARWDGPLRVHTDVLTASLARSGAPKHRHQFLLTPVSVISLPSERTFYTLAAHPGFLPMGRSGLSAMLADLNRRRMSGEPAHVSPWGCFLHPMGTDPAKSTREQFLARPEFSQYGQFLVEQHMLLAHFLAVRKLLSRFPKVCHYMDGSLAQMCAALTALADEVRAGRWEMAAVQAHGRKFKSTAPRLVGPRTPETLGPRLDWAWAGLESRWAERRRRGANWLRRTGRSMPGCSGRR